MEIARVLKSGALFIGGDKYALDDEISHKDSLRNCIQMFDAFEIMGKPEMKEEWTNHYLEDDKIRFSEKEQKEILRELGFSQIAIRYRKGMEAIFTAIR